MIRTVVTAALAALSLSSSALAANNFVVKDGNAVVITKCSVQQSDSSQADCNVLKDSTGVVINPATKESVAALSTKLDALIAALGTPFQAGASIGNPSFGISGTLPSFASVPTFNLGTLNGAATSAKQDALLAALGTPLQAGGVIGNASFGISGTLPAFAATPTFNLGTLNGAALAANQAPLTTPGALGTSGSTVTMVLPQISAQDIGGSFGTSAVQLTGINLSRHFIQLQIQGAPDTSGAVGCYINGGGTATADYHSLFIPRGGFLESATHVGTGAISIICTGTMAVYGRQG